SRSFAATRFTHRSGGSRMWSSTEMSQFRSSSADTVPPFVSCFSSRQLADDQVLDLLELADPLGPAFAAEAALLVAAAGGVGAEECGVDVHRAGAQAPADAGGRGDVGAVDLVGQAVPGVVGHVDGVVEVPVADHGENRPEDLLPRGGVAVVGDVEQRRLDVIALVEPGRAPAADD